MIIHKQFNAIIKDRVFKFWKISLVFGRKENDQSLKLNSLELQLCGLGEILAHDFNFLCLFKGFLSEFKKSPFS